MDPRKGDPRRVTYKGKVSLGRAEKNEYVKEELGPQGVGSLGKTAIQVCGTPGLSRLVKVASRHHISERVHFQNCSF